MARPYSHIGLQHLFCRLPIAHDPDDDYCQNLVHAHATLDALASLEDAGVPQVELPLHWEDARIRALHTLTLSLTIAAPGVPSALRAAAAKRSNLAFQSTGDDNEQAAIELVATHRAIARSGGAVVLPPIPDELFEELALLESQYVEQARASSAIIGLNSLDVAVPEEDGKCGPDSVMVQLRRLGSKIAEFLLAHVSSYLLSRAREILVFSQFPVGLAILPGHTSPLSFVKPVYYRPLQPLTRTLQQELLERPACLFQPRRLRVLIIECLATNDHIYPFSIRTWNFVQSQLSTRFDVSVVHADSIPSLRNAVESHTCDVLILSAHGASGPAMNQQSLVVGSELYTGVEIMHMPPIVLLSACKTSPRGTGTVNVADMLLRQGTYAVVCTLVPVDVRHNGVLFVRLLTNIGVAQAGGLEMETLAEVFAYTTMSNAVSDIVHSASRHSTNELEWRTMQYEFMRKRSSGCLRLSHVYEDSEAVLREIARDRGDEDRMGSLLSSTDCLPESTMYMLLGWPEKVILHSELRTKAIAWAADRDNPRGPDQEEPRTDANRASPRPKRRRTRKVRRSRVRPSERIRGRHLS